MATTKPTEQAGDKTVVTVEVVAAKAGTFKRKPYAKGEKLSVTQAQKAIMLQQGVIEGDS